jgi:WhiB family redox-sensing transcriptional regulator
MASRAAQGRIRTTHDDEADDQLGLFGQLSVVGQDWMRHARCKGMVSNLFFPDEGADATEARETCERCEVRQACLEYALDQGIAHGIWGGLDEHERVALGMMTPRCPNGHLMTEENTVNRRGTNSCITCERERTKRSRERRRGPQRAAS